MTESDDAFVQQHTPMVRKLAHRLRAELDLTCEVEDLIAYGMAGLVEARQRFDPSRGVQFSTFAHYRVRGAILDGVRTMAYLSRRAHQKRRAAEAFDLEMEAQGEARAAAPEQRTDLEGTLAAIDDVLTKTSASFLLQCVGQDESEPRATPEDNLIGASESARVREALEILPEREAIVIRGMYFEGRNLDDIGAQLGVSKSWACRIHTKALGLLRDQLEIGWAKKILDER